ncbi:MAG: SMP-30/gluconolactonase/LRE family protein [Flammeovirgaceae bacterium]|nr:SMP-30/gluconolactonase/LRE family protein [Flammeovirgaceae bacterium]
MRMKSTFLIFTLIATIIIGCKPKEEPITTEVEETEEEEVAKYETTGTIEVVSPKLHDLIPKGNQLEIIAEGFGWSEGPLWVPSQNMLLFTDIPPNKIVKWTEENGAELYLTPAGYTGEEERGGEVGANGLILDSDGNLVLCQHGNRQMAKMDAPLDQPAPNYIAIADNYDGKKFNSPNDATYKSNGELYFTDPPYGLEKNMDDPSKEIPFQGVYKADAEGNVVLLTDELTRPNGIAFSPNEKILYVANSDPDKAIWMAYDVKEDGTIENGRVFYDATDNSKAGEKGLPDGLKIDNMGNIFATGPGGVWIFTDEGEHLGTLKTGQATSNCAFNEDKSVLYITADMYLMRINLK